jgi:hypothetical protein
MGLKRLVKSSTFSVLGIVTMAVVVFAALLYSVRPLHQVLDAASGGKDVGKVSVAHGLATVPSQARGAANRMDSYTSVESLKSRVRRAIAANNYQELEASLTLLTDIDPVAAAALAKSTDDTFRTEALGWVARSWAEGDPYAVLKWAAGLTNSPMGLDRDHVVCIACESIARTDPETALALLTQYRIKPDALIYQNIASKWAVEDFDAAEAWAESSAPAESRSPIFINLVTELAKTDPIAAISLLRKELPSGADQSAAAIQVILEWAPRDRAAAAAWVATFPPGDTKQKAEQALDGKGPRWWSPSPHSGWD